MHILPIKTFSYTNKIFNMNNINTPQTAPIKTDIIDTISFGRTAKNAEALRALMEYGVPGMYSGITVIAPKSIEKLYAKRYYSKHITSIVKILIPYEKSLLPIEKQFFNIVKQYASTKPEYTLSDVIREIAPIHNKKLLIKQKPIFEELNALADNMPQELQLLYKDMMSIVNKKLSREPITIPFDSKEFQYKLQRISDELKQKNQNYEAKIIQKMIRIAKRIPEKPLHTKSEENITSKVKRSKKQKKEKAIIRKQSDILTSIEILAAETNLKNNPELMKILSQTRARIYSVPVVTPFNRKSFIFELQKITNQLGDSKLAHKMIQKALQLPTSHDNLSAFIMKCVEYSSDKIIYNMISGSAGSIDHLIPYTKNGKDCIENYGISSAYYNSERAERSIVQQLRKHPETYVNCQKHVDRLIELYNMGIFKKVKLPRQYIINFAKRMYNLSPEDNRLVLDLSKLKK